MTTDERTDLRETLNSTDGLTVRDTLNADALVSFFADYDLVHEDAERVVRISNGEETYIPDHMKNAPSRADQALYCLSDALGYHGVEVLRDESHRGYFGDARYLYVNSGGTYLPELYYSTDLGVWILGDADTLIRADESLQ